MEQQLSPQLLEPSWISGCAANAVLNVAVPEIVLHKQGFRALVGKGIAAGREQHVGMNGNVEAGFLSVFVQQQVDG